MCPACPKVSPALALDSGLALPEACLHVATASRLGAAHGDVVVLAALGSAIQTGCVEWVRAALALLLQCTAPATLEVVATGAAALARPARFGERRSACVAALRWRERVLSLELEAGAWAVAAAARIAVGRAVV